MQAESLSGRLDNGMTLPGHTVERHEQDYGGKHFTWYVIDGHALPKAVSPIPIEQQVG